MKYIVKKKRKMGKKRMGEDKILMIYLQKTISERNIFEGLT
jgi:hypothetical protein